MHHVPLNSQPTPRHATSPTGFHFHHHDPNTSFVPTTQTNGALNAAAHEVNNRDGEWERELLLLGMATRSSAPPLLRRSSSADIPIPQFMIPSSAHQLMNKRYALASSS